jgi:hypothetical protein
LHAAWLARSVTPHKSLKVVLGKRLFVFSRVVSAAWEMETTGPIREKELRLGGCILRSQIQRRSDLGNQSCNQVRAMKKTFC